MNLLDRSFGNTTRLFDRTQEISRRTVSTSNFHQAMTGDEGRSLLFNRDAIPGLHCRSVGDFERRRARYAAWLAGKEIGCPKLSPRFIPAPFE